MISRVCASSAANGSSINSTSAPAESARAMLTRWRMPPESSCGKWRPKPREADEAQELVGDAVARRGAVAPLDLRAERRIAGDGAPGQQAVLLEHEGDAVARLGDGFAVDRHLPRVGSIRPSTRRRNVVLPQPDAPTMLTNSPGWMSISRSRRTSVVTSPLRNDLRRADGFRAWPAWSFAVIVGTPGGELQLEPFQQLDRHHAGHRQHDARRRTGRPCRTPARH